MDLLVHVPVIASVELVFVSFASRYMYFRHLRIDGIDAKEREAFPIKNVSLYKKMEIDVRS